MFALVNANVSAIALTPQDICALTYTHIYAIAYGLIPDLISVFAEKSSFKIKKA
jgi:hypothetical protein